MVQYNPGKWHRGPDAISRNPVLAIASLPDNIDDADEQEMESHIAYTTESVFTGDSSVDVTSLEKSIRSAQSDPSSQMLIRTISTGFPKAIGNISCLKPFWNVRDKLSLYNDQIVLMGDRLVIPSSLRSQIIRNLHGAHQGVSSITRRANHGVLARDFFRH